MCASVDFLSNKRVRFTSCLVNNFPPCLVLGIDRSEVLRNVLSGAFVGLFRSSDAILFIVNSRSEVLAIRCAEVIDFSFQTI